MNYEIKPYTRIVEITPDDARQILEGNTKNRPLAKTVIERYARDMKNNSWKMNGETIKISSDGRVIDGQHRLCAIIKSGKAITSMVTYDLDFDVFDTVDCGQKRSAGHVFAIKGEKNYTNLACATRLYARYKRNEIDKPDNTLTTADIEKTLADNPGLRESVEIAAKHYTKVMSLSHAAACHYIFSQLNKDDADIFIVKLLTGIGINASDPVHRLRSRLIDNSLSKSKLPVAYIIALTFKAWNFFRDGKPVKSLRYRTDGDSAEAFPIPQ
jgi:hypothetical protein